MEYNESYIVAYLENRLSENERHELEKHMAESPDFREKVNDFCYLYEASRTLSSEDTFHVRQNWLELREQIHQHKHRKITRFRRTMLAAASVVLLVIGISAYYYSISRPAFMENIDDIMQQVESSDDIQLILSDAQQMNIKGDSSKLSYNTDGILSVNAKEVNTSSNKEESPRQVEETLRYNQLVVPSGKRANITLADGTVVWVNANSRVVYPVVFSHKQRGLYVEGEIFLNVHPDKERPFIVKSKQFDIEVVGTSFNVSAYKDEATASIALATGEVHVYTRNHDKEKLFPNQVLQYSASAGIKKQEVDNISHYFSWKDGVFHFNHDPFSVVLDKLSRYYGKRIVYTPEAGKLYCSGTLNLCNNLNELLEGLCHTMPVQVNYETESIKISIKP